MPSLPTTPPPKDTTSTPELRSTPMVQKVSSTRCDKNSQEKKLKVDALEMLLKKELSDAIHYDCENLIESVFPDSRLPFSITETLLKAVSDDVEMLEKASTESALSAWMTDVGAALARHTQQSSTRMWDPSKCNSILKGSVHDRKPDLMLLDHTRPSDQQATWPIVRGLCEVTTIPSFTPKIRETLFQKSFIIFSTQHDRRFVPSLSFYGSTFRFLVADRAGIVQSPDYDIKSNLFILLRVIAGFMFGDDELIGYDTTMHHGSDGEIVAITVGGIEYSVVEKIFSAETLRGRATQCWRVRRGEQEYVLKDSWIHNGRTTSEIDTLATLTDIEDIPKLIAGEDVKLLDGKVDSTNLRRTGITHDEERLHRRLVMGPVAEPLSSFKCKKELIGAIIHIIEAHKAICERKRILHRDVSHNNIMLYKLAQSGEGLRRGLLIDFDYAMTLEPLVNNNSCYKGHRTGTAPFMSMEVLKNDDIVQKPAHDLESVFYVLLYFCMQYKGPGMCRDKTDINKLTSYCIGTWFEPNTFDILALRKRDHLEDISKRFVAKFDPYFADLSDCMLQLWDVLFPPDMTAKGIKYRGLFKCEATHDGMLKILRHTYHNLPEVDPPAPPSAAVAKPTASTRKPPTCKKSQKASSQAASSSRAAFSSRKASSSRNASSSRQVSPPETRSSNGRKRHAPDAPDDPIGAQPSSSNHRVGDREASLHSGPAKRIRSTSEKKA